MRRGKQLSLGRVWRRGRCPLLQGWVCAQDGAAALSPRVWGVEINVDNRSLSCLVSPVPLLVLLCLGWSERSWEWDRGGVQGHSVAPRALPQWVPPWDAAMTPKTFPSVEGGEQGSGMRIPVNALQRCQWWFTPSVSFDRGRGGAAFLLHPH